MTDAESLAPSRSEATRAALVGAALELFGAKGFEATSTREIAAAAGANIAAIAYHFGGKEGLRAACADFVVATIGEIFAARRGRAPSRSTRLTPAEARDALARIAAALIDAIVVARRGAPDRALRAARDVRALGRVRAPLWRASAPMHARACAVWARATGAPAESEATRLAVFALIGQIIYFRLARPGGAAPHGLARHRSRARPPPSSVVVIGNLDAAIDLARKTPHDPRNDLRDRADRQDPARLRAARRTPPSAMSRANMSMSRRSRSRASPTNTSGAATG